MPSLMTPRISPLNGAGSTPEETVRPLTRSPLAIPETGAAGMQSSVGAADTAGGAVTAAAVLTSAADATSAAAMRPRRRALLYMVTPSPRRA